MQEPRHLPHLRQIVRFVHFHDIPALISYYKNNIIAQSMQHNFYFFMNNIQQKHEG